MEGKTQTHSLRPDIAAYIAGLIDGEGTITLTRLHVGENRRLVVSIANTELQILQFVLHEVGAGKITNKQVASSRHAPSFNYAITSKQALGLLRQVSPWLQSYRKHRAALVLRSYSALTPRNGKYSEDLLHRRIDFEREFLDLKSIRNCRHIPFQNVHPGTIVTSNHDGCAASCQID